MNFAKHSKPIEGFEKYRVFENGRIINRNNMELKQTKNRDGYLMVKLCDNGREKNCSVHRLVANAFIPNPEHKPQVNHIDGDKSNNDISNLEWCTNGENQKHAYDNDLRRSHLTYEDRKNGARISGELRSRKVRVVETGVVYSNAKACADDLGCYESAINRCCHKKANQHHGYHFEWAGEC